MRRWPPLAWIILALASLYILTGTGKWRHWELIVGGILAAIGLGVSIYLALASWPKGERPRFVTWTIGGTALFYVLIGVVAGQAGPEYAVAGLAAGVFPLAAAALIVATARQVGVDDETPFGDSPELSSASEDPEVHPGRRWEQERAQRAATRR